MFKEKRNTKRSSLPAGGKGNVHELTTLPRIKFIRHDKTNLWKFMS